MPLTQVQTARTQLVTCVVVRLEFRKSNFKGNLTYVPSREDPRPVLGYELFACRNPLTVVHFESPVLSRGETEPVFGGPDTVPAAFAGLVADLKGCGHHGGGRVMA